MTDIRVTQAGRQVITQEDADIRVTQAGRQVITQEDADIRVTMAGRQVAVGIADGDLRVTAMGRVALIAEPKPTQPTLLSPTDGGTYQDVLPIIYTESEDPLGGDVWYFAQIKKTTDTVWTSIFADRLGVEPYLLDISGYDDDDYDFKLWSETIGYVSSVSAVEITIGNGMPTAPVITAPHPGEVWKLTTTNYVDWDPATDPDDDPLTYAARYKKLSASSWSSLFSSETAGPYGWNTSGLDADDYVLEIWANDGVIDGPHAQTFFTLDDIDRPGIPTLRVIAFNSNSFTVEIMEYTHVASAAWKATKWELIPFGGSWSNPIESVTITDSAEQLLHTFSPYPPGFFGLLRASFQDENDVWGPTSIEIEVGTTDTSFHGVRKGYPSDWSPGFGGVVDYRYRPGYDGKLSAFINDDAEVVGSALLHATLMPKGSQSGWAGYPAEYVGGGIGIFGGYGEDDRLIGVGGGLWMGSAAWAITGVPGDMYCNGFVAAYFDECSVYSGNSKWKISTPPFLLTGQVLPSDPWGGGPLGKPAHIAIQPFYQLTVWIQRNLSLGTTRVRMALGYVSIRSIFDTEFSSVGIATDEWLVDLTLPCVTPCGKPGICGYGGYGGGSVSVLNMTYTALRDSGQEPLVNVPPLPHYEQGEGAYAIVTEDALADPVFFPAPPNGDITEDVIYPTDVILGRDDSEQRVSLRENGVEKIGWTVTLPTARELMNVRALLWEDQPSRIGVPLWMDAARLEVDLASGAGTIPAASIDTATRRFDEVSYVAIWEDQFTWDFLPAVLNADGSITLTGTTSRAYDAFSAYVIPCKVGHLGDTASFSRVSPAIGDYDVEFYLEGVDG